MPEKIGDLPEEERIGREEDEADRRKGLEAVRVDPVAAKAYPSSDDLRACVLTPAREAEARRRRDKPHYSDEIVCALVNALDESRRALARVTIQYDEATTRGGFVNAFDAMQTAAYENSVAHGFYDGTERNFGEAIALMHSELSEALEYARKDPDGKSDHIPEFTGIEEEFADVIIRIMDLAGNRKLRVAPAVLAKHRFNVARPFKHGKAF